MDAADSYKLWARRQAWARPKEGPTATPDWLKKGYVTLAGCSFRPLGNGKYIVPLERVPDAVRQWREALGAESVFTDMRGWERNGTYASPDYFPFFPSPETVRQVNAAIAATGGHSNAMVSGLRWTIERREQGDKQGIFFPGFDGRKRFEEAGRDVCIIDRDGKVHRQEWGDTGINSTICPATQFAEDHVRRVAAELARAGFSQYEFDQLNGGAVPYCYSTKHGHPPGPGPWIAQRIYHLMALARTTGRAINPEFAIGLEDPCEIYLPVMDSYLSRVDNVVKHCGEGPYSQAVPAFEYVYHPLARSQEIDNYMTFVTPVWTSLLSGDNTIKSVGAFVWRRLFRKKDKDNMIQTARAFVGGCSLATDMGIYATFYRYGENNTWSAPEKADPASLKLLKACVATHCGPGLPYLSYGEMLNAEPVKSPLNGEWPKVFTDYKGDKFPYTLRHPLLLGSAWQASNGRQAFFFVNIAEEEQRLVYGFAVSGRRPEPSTPVRLFRDGKLVEQTSLRKLAGVSVPPLATLMVELRPEQ